MASKLPCAGLAAVVVLIIPPAALATDAIPLGGGVRINGSALTGELAAPTDVHNQVFSDGWTGQPATVSTTADLSASDPGGTVRVGGTAAAVWDSATSGQLTLSDFGWSVEPSGLNTPYLIGWVSLCGLNCNDPQGVWSYTFTAVTDGGFHMTYQVSEQQTGSHTDDHGWFLTDGNYFADGNTAVPGSGELVGIPLKAGVTYTVSLGSNMLLGGGLFPTTDTVNAVFNWEITQEGVPEPGLWTMAIMGFVLAGGMLRRRRAHRPSPDQDATAGDARQAAAASA